MSYSHRGIELPEDTQEAIDRYVNHGIPPGDFLQAVIANDLTEACGRADETNLVALPAIVAYFYNRCPSPCWKRPNAMRDWIEMKRKEYEG